MPTPTEAFRFVEQWQEIANDLLSDDPGRRQAAVDALVRRDIDLEDHLVDTARRGTVSGTTDASGLLSVVYTTNARPAKAFSVATEQVLVTPRGTGYAAAVEITAVASTGFTVKFYNAAGAALASSAASFDFIAFGR